MVKTIFMFIISIFTLCIFGCDTYYVEGSPGVQGPAGEKGDPGIPGEPGASGQDGINGESFRACSDEFACPEGYVCGPQGVCLLSEGHTQPIPENTCEPFNVFPGVNGSGSMPTIQLFTFGGRDGYNGDQINLGGLLSTMSGCGEGYVITDFGVRLYGFPDDTWFPQPVVMSVFIGDAGYSAFCNEFYINSYNGRELRCFMRDLDVEILTSQNSTHLSVKVSDLPDVPVGNLLALTVGLLWQDIETQNGYQSDFNEYAWFANPVETAVFSFEGN